jgi:hypothetical protein
MTPKKRRLWNQVNLILELKKIAFAHDVEQVDFFQKCWFFMEQTNCSPEDAVNHFAEMKMKEPPTTVAPPENIVEDVWDEMPEPMAVTVSRKGKKK